MFIKHFFAETYKPDHALTCSKGWFGQIENTINLFGRHLSRQAEVSDLTKKTVVEFLAERRECVSPSTVNRDRYNILTIWRHAADNGLIDQPPRISRVPVPESTPHTFRVHDVGALLSGCNQMPDPLWWRSLILFMYSTGCRLGAALQVKKSDFNLEDRYVVLRGKTSKNRRESVVSLRQDAVVAIKAQTLYRDNDEQVWKWLRCHRQIWFWFARLCELSGVSVPRGKKFHSLRRTHATQIAVAFGMDAASRQLDHSSIKVTRRYVDRAQLPISRISDDLPEPSHCHNESEVQT